MPGYGLFGKLTTEPQQRETLANILLEAAALMQDAPGCHSYIVSLDANDAGAVWVLELWDSKEAHDSSLSLPAVRELIARAMPLLKGSPQGISVTPLGGRGL